MGRAKELQRYLKLDVINVYFYCRYFLKCGVFIGR